MVAAQGDHLGMQLSGLGVERSIEYLIDARRCSMPFDMCRVRRTMKQRQVALFHLLQCQSVVERGHWNVSAIKDLLSALVHVETQRDVIASELGHTFAIVPYAAGSKASARPEADGSVEWHTNDAHVKVVPGSELFRAIGDVSCNGRKTCPEGQVAKCTQAGEDRIARGCLEIDLGVCS